MAEITTTQSFADGDTVTAAKLNNIIANASVGSEAVTNRSELTSVDGANDFLLIYDTSAAGLRKIKPNNTLDNSSVSTAKIADSAVTTSKVADSNITTSKIADSGVTTAKIADSAITTAKIAAGAVITADLADSSVTTAKINDAAVTTAKINDGSVTVAKLSNPQYTGFRNRIINGDMRIDQRNAGASVTIGAVNGTYILDRYSWYTSQASKLSTQRSTVAPSGFSNSMLITSLSAYSITSTDYFWFRQGIEGFNVSDLAWGTASAGSVTLSFWVRSSLTGTFGGSLYNETAGYNCPFSYSISAADTWERKTVLISGATTGTWKTNQDCGVFVQWTLGSGSTRTGGTSGTWQASSTDGPNGITSLVGTNGATFYITGVQLEAGSTATDFERRPYGTELALCQRYYCKSYAVSVAPATSSVEGYATHGGLAGSTANSRSSHRFPVEMRASPTMLYWDYVGNSQRESSHNSSNSRTDNIASGSFSLTPSASGFGFNDAGGAGQAGSGAWWSLVHWTANSEL